MNDKILTISIAAYNVEKYLHKTLDSLLTDEETLNKMEVIIVDDGSKDSTPQIAREYSEKYKETFFLITKKNGGWGSTVNCGIENAHGKYFRILDGDDWFSTENLRDYILFLQETNADLVLAPYVKVYQGSDRNEVIFRHPLQDGKKYLISDLPQLENFRMHELTVRTEILKTNSIKITEHCFYTDGEYAFLPCLYAQNVILFKKIIYCYRIGIGEQSVSISSRKRNWHDGDVVAKRLIKEFISHREGLAQPMVNILYALLKSLTKFQYSNYFIADYSKEVETDLKEFDVFIKSNLPELYKEIGKGSKKLRLLRISGFHLLKLLTRYSEWKRK